MQYNKKTWANRETEYPNQYRMVSTNGNIANVSIVPDSGAITVEGEKFDADTMNDLESRIDSGFNAVNTEISTQDTTLRGLITAETTRAMGEEGLIDNAIAQLNTDLAAEVTRATGAEDALSTDVSGLTTRIDNAEDEIDSLESRMTNAESDISTFGSRVTGLETSISVETNRAEQAELTLQGHIDTVSSAIEGETARALAAESALQNDINTKIAGAYKPSGSLYFADLPTLDSSNSGKVYYVLDAFTTTADFIDGAGIDYPAGTYVSIIYNDDPMVLAYMYDAMTGIIDTSMFVQKTDYATTAVAGVIRPDGTTTSVNASGELSVIGGASSGGHTILDSNGTALTQEDNLQFMESIIVDDGLNEKTVVQPAYFRGTQAQWEALSLSEQAKYTTRDIIDDFNGAAIDSVPTQGSTNAVSSGGVYTYVDTMITQALNASY